MRIHTSAESSVIYDAARLARADLVRLTRHGSRSRDHAFDVKLEGESRRRPHGGDSGAGSGYAATWDQWGVFLAHIFDVDPSATCWAYSDADTFDFMTGYRFSPDESNRADGSKYWPNDAHGDHTWRWSGVPRQQSCTKCSAVRSW